MKQINSNKIDRDLRYGQAVMLVTTPDQDTNEGKDYVIGNFGIAWRKRRLPLSKYRQISIRYKRIFGKPTEFTKITAGQTKAQLYVFEFLDCYVICTMADIADCLKHGLYQVVDNHDAEGTVACYIDVEKITHLLITKGTYG